MSKHTPGPWLIASDGDPDDFAIHTSDELGIAMVCGEANALLIAAAAEMYDLLVRLSGWDMFTTPEAHGADFTFWKFQIDRVIAKAEASVLVCPTCLCEVRGARCETAECPGGTPVLLPSKQIQEGSKSNG